MEISKLFKRKIPRYEIYVLMCNEEAVNERMKVLYDNGFEMCGDVLVKNQSGWCRDNYVHIPFKRKIDKSNTKWIFKSSE